MRTVREKCLKFQTIQHIMFQPTGKPIIGTTVEALAVLPKANRVDAQVGRTLFSHFYMCRNRGGSGRGFDPPTLKNRKNIGFFTGPDPLKTKPAFNVGPS